MTKIVNQKKIVTLKVLLMVWKQRKKRSMITNGKKKDGRKNKMQENGVRSMDFGNYAITELK